VDISDRRAQATVDPSTLLRLRTATRAIREALLQDFRDRHRPRYARLLEAFDKKGIPIAGLSVCGMGSDEIRYTQLLRYFLDPDEAHGLGARVISAVFEPELGGCYSEFVLDQWDHASVQAEYYLGAVMSGSRSIGSVVDIFVETPTTLVLIEHKIGSPESGRATGGEVTQLRRYSKALQASFAERSHRRSLKIFLTPDGRAPKEDRDWVPLTHRTLIARLVPLLHSSELSEVAKHNLRCLLWDLATGPLGFDEAMQPKLCYYIRQALDNRSRYLLLQRWARENSIDVELLAGILE
jgi:hypothetical protein